jgi:hypothetical protein
MRYNLPPDGGNSGWFAQNSSDNRLPEELSGRGDLCMKNVVREWTAVALGLIVISSTSSAAVIGTKPWTAVGAAGTVVAGQVDFSGQVAYLDADSAVLIYNVVAVDGLTETGGALLTHPFMKVRFRDNGANNRIVARLRRIDLNTGVSQILMTLDSDNYVGSGSFQTREIGCGNSFSFDFSNHAYFVEITMTRTGLPVTPGISALQLGRSNSPCLVPVP